ncbi:MAG TPA: T9SS type A sorting domain-containing protein, partial [Saprospiraceae bacterium]|nr:T9SS type A sorting domain-containing protein [Saprospiraceae bacterium]
PVCGNWANITNNTMAWIGGYQSSLSPCQIDKIHTNMSTFLSPYVSCDPVTFPTSLSIEVSPNPNLGNFDIRFESAKTQKIQFAIYDKQGNMVMPLRSINTKSLEKFIEKINSNLPPDLYIIIALGEDGSYAHKQISIN